MSTNMFEGLPFTSSLQPVNFLKPQPESEPPPQPQQKKRTQVAQACDWCRAHRIKCDSDRPCTNCKKRGGPCSNSRPVRSTLPQAYREIESLRQKIQEQEAELQQYRSAEKPVVLHGLPTPPGLISPTLTDQQTRSTLSNIPSTASGRAKNVWEGIFISTARSPQQTWYGPSSLFYFIGCINTFLTSALKQTHQIQRMLLKSSNNLSDGPSTVGEEHKQSSRSAAFSGNPICESVCLTATQEEYFLSLFWQSYYNSYPILDELEFKKHYQSLWATPDKERKPSALVDIVLALCMQYGMAKVTSAGRSGAGSIQNLNTHDTSIAGRWHYQRCLTLLAGELENPAISTVQCHVLCCIYLCCGSFQNMADNACGLAVRTAIMLGLHLEPPEDMPSRERELRKRLWWTLYGLETKMSMKLGRPFLVQDHCTTCSFPADDLETAMLAGSSFAPLGDNVTWLTWSLHNTKLLLAARHAYTIILNHGPDSLNVCDSQPATELMDEWLRGVPDALKTKRQNNGVPFSTDQSPLDVGHFTPVWLQRQRLLLELMYHNLCTNLYRPSISFVLTQSPSHVAERTAVKCAAHAMALTHIMHHVILSTSILAGWHEAFQWQWNASMTLVGFVFAYPQGSLTVSARCAIDLSIAVLEDFGNSFAIAGSAATILSDLRAKVDIVVEQSQRKQGGGRKQPQQHQQQQLNLNAVNEKLQLIIPDSEETGYNLLPNGDFSAAQSLDESLILDSQATAEIMEILAQSMDISAETYHDLDSSGAYWNFPDQRLLMQQ
jgi:hypothetical protein